MTGAADLVPIRVLVAAAYPMSRAGLSAVVSGDARLALAGQVDGVEALVEAAEMIAPGVVLLDPGDDAETWLEPLWQLAETQTLPPVLVIAGSTSVAWQTVHRGAEGVLLRDANAEEIVAALISVALGLTVFDRRVGAELMAQLEAAPAREPGSAEVEPLTSREREVLELIARGLPNKAIAVELGISEHTVKFHVGSVLAKLGAASRAEALARAARLGLIAL